MHCALCFLRYFVVGATLPGMPARSAWPHRRASTPRWISAPRLLRILHRPPPTDLALVVLCYSRHIFVWPMLRQQLEAVIEGLEAAWRFFGGVPCHLILDNFPAAVAKADSLSPRLTKGFLDYAQFRGFLPDPARVRHPKDKPHAERGVPYVRDRFFAGASFLDLADMRTQAEHWCKEVAGSRIHGTTHQTLPTLLEDRCLTSFLETGGYVPSTPHRSTTISRGVPSASTRPLELVSTRLPRRSSRGCRPDSHLPQGRPRQGSSASLGWPLHRYRRLPAHKSPYALRP